jgi:hypothetical protein
MRLDRGVLFFAVCLGSGCSFAPGELRADGPVSSRLLVMDCAVARCAVRQGATEVADGLGIYGPRLGNVLQEVPAARSHHRRARAAFGAALGLTVPTAAAIAFGGFIGLGSPENAQLFGVSNRLGTASGLLVAGVVLFAVDMLVAAYSGDETGRALQAYNLEMVRRFEATLVPITPAAAGQPQGTINSPAP